VPEEWNIEDAYIAVDGRRVAIVGNSDALGALTATAILALAIVVVVRPALGRRDRVPILDHVGLRNCRRAKDRG
jgi:hypothetical protein